MCIVVNIIGSCANVGKTSVIEGVIKELKQRGYSVATIKHDTHDFEIDKEGKDTWRHRKAGADMVIISSKNKRAMIQEVSEEISLESLVEEVSHYDFVLIEGYKRSKYKKIEVFRSGVSKSIITPRDKLIAVVSDVPKRVGNIPVLNIQDYKSITDVILSIQQM